MVKAVKKKKFKISKELRDWIIILIVIGVLRFTGWHVPVISLFQRALVATNLVQPNRVEEEINASFNLVLEDSENNRIPLSEFKGQVIFMNFWATWCPPCLAEMPGIHQLYLELKDEVVFVMISKDRDFEKAKKWIRSKDYEFPVYFIRSPIPQVYQSDVIPATYVISRDEKVKVQNFGLASYDTEKFKSFLRSL